MRKLILISTNTTPCYCSTTASTSISFRHLIRFPPASWWRSKHLLQLLALLSVHCLLIPLLVPLVAVGPLPAAIALHNCTWCLAVRADLEADVALDLVLALTRGFGGGWPSAHRSFIAHMKFSLKFSLNHLFSYFVRRR